MLLGSQDDDEEPPGSRQPSGDHAPRERSMRAPRRGRAVADAAAGPADGEGGGAAGPESPVARMLRLRKAGGGGAASGSAPAAGGPPALRPLDPEVMAERRRRNPRDAPKQGEDPDYG